MIGPAEHAPMSEGPVVRGTTTLPPAHGDTPNAQTAATPAQTFARPRFSRPALALCAAGKVATAALFPFSHFAAAVAFFGGDLFVLYHLLVPAAQGMGRTFTRFSTTAREIWLTIDDGPDPSDTPQILDLLDQHAARATFFVVGKRAAQHPELIAEILRRGHQVAHHTYEHAVGTFWFASPTRVRSELDRTLQTLRSAGAVP